jgi:excinuclease UvrABC nuclease subunit
MILTDLIKYNLPDHPGVYFFKKGETILYIGKATSLQDRVKSYFNDNVLHERGLHIGNMVTLADNIEYKETRSVLEALLLENELIKKYNPQYNTKEKDDKSYFVLAITDEDFPRVLLLRKRNIDENGVEKSGIKVKEIFGPYGSGEAIRESLKVIRKIFPFRDKCEVFDKKKAWQKKPCFSYQIGLCPGTCAGVINKKQYSKYVDRLKLFLHGDGEAVRRELEKDMYEASKGLKFEEAQKLKDTLFALDHVRDAHLLKREGNTDNVRIEAFDISHISGTDRVGVMTVVEGGVVAKHAYRKFKVSSDKNDDLEGTREILERRLTHLLDWGVPDVLVLDGDDRHMRVAEEVLQKQNTGPHPDLPPMGEGVEHRIQIVAVTKDKRHKAKAIIGNAEIIKKYQKEIILANAEAHRFALRYHRDLRGKGLKIKKK